MQLTPDACCFRAGAHFALSLSLSLAVSQSPGSPASARRARTNNKSRSAERKRENREVWRIEKRQWPRRPATRRSIRRFTRTIGRARSLAPAEAAAALVGITLDWPSEAKTIRGASPALYYKNAHTLLTPLETFRDGRQHETISRKTGTSYSIEDLVRAPD